MRISNQKPSSKEWGAVQSCLPSSHQFLGLSWFESWSKNFLPFESWSGPMQYLTISDEQDQTIGIFPLAFQSKKYLRFASLGGYYQPFRGIPIKSNSTRDVFLALVQYFAKQKDFFALRMGPVCQNDCVMAELIDVLQQERWALRKLAVGENYVIHLPDNWEEFLLQRGKSLRFNMNYYERKMKKDGNFDICHSTSVSRHDWGSILADLESIEQQSWLKVEGGDFRFSGRKNKEFWFDVLSSHDTSYVVNVWILYFNGEPGSFCFTLDSGHIRYILANNYDEHLKKYSTGTILYKYVFMDAINKSMRTVNIGLGNSGYKSRWGASQGETLVDWFASPPGMVGKLVDGLLGLWTRF